MCDVGGWERAEIDQPQLAEEAPGVGRRWRGPEVLAGDVALGRLVVGEALRRQPEVAGEAVNREQQTLFGEGGSSSSRKDRQTFRHGVSNWPAREAIR